MAILNFANQITIVRILLIVPFILSMLHINDPSKAFLFRYMAFAIFLIMSISDAIDGYIARHFNQTTRLGSFLDPLADKLLMTCACILLASNISSVQGFRLPLEVVVLIIGKDVILTIGFIIVYLMTTKTTIVPSNIGKICTFLQLTMVGATLVAPEITSFFIFWPWLIRLLWIFSGLTAILATLIYILQGSRYIECSQLDMRQRL